MAKTGRPRKEIPKELFESLCEIQCTLEDICSVLHVSADTLENWCKREYKDEDGTGMTFSKVFNQKKGAGKASLRRMQWRLAEKNPTMAIFLGKQYLGQRDSVTVGIGPAQQEDDPITKALKEAAADGLKR